jgi:fido (protein-threonine AMPylation protein)
VAQRGRPSRQTIFAQVHSAVAELHDRLGGLPSPHEAEDIWGDIWYHEAHNSTAIEGNTLALHQVELLLRENRTVGSKELREYNEVRGYADAAQWVYSQAATSAVHRRADDLLTLQDLRNIHHAAMTPVWSVAPHPAATADEAPGNFRRHNIQPFRGGMRPPDFTEVPAQLSSWLADVQRLWVRRATDPPPSTPLIQRVAERHAEFERIHPFLDGNGRVGRLSTNLVLVRMGYPPIIVDKRDRARYLTALDRADRGDVGALAELFARAMLASLNRFIIPAVAGPARFVPLAALANRNVSARALRQAAERGRLRATKGDDGLWRSSRRLVEQYVKSRHQRLKV